jgi:hypothetical protein
LSSLVTIRLFRDPLEAVAAKDTLAAEGVGSVVIYEPPLPLNAHHHFPTLESAELQVREEDREKALAMLDGGGMPPE